MSHNEKMVAATPNQVWKILADGWLFPLWVVGASRVRDVDTTWPAVGSKIHHSVGTWPTLIDDHTEVLEVHPSTMLRLKARGWPMGEAEVTITLEAVGARTRVVIEEDAVAGPGAYVPKPFRALMLTWRNVETLRRLAYVAEGRS